MHRINLLKLIQDNADKPKSFSIRQEDDEATVYVYDVIGGLWGGVDAEQFARDLAEIKAKTINLRINSPGGDVFDARAIATALRSHPATVNAYIDGWAASAATTIAMAADRVEIAEGGFFMIHNAWALAIGNRHELLDLASLLEKIDNAIAADYAKRTGADLEQIAQWMDDETWFEASEAVEHGFADAVMQESSDKNNSAGKWNLSAYRNAPKPKPAPDPTDNDDSLHFRQELDRRLTLLEKCSA